MAKSKAKFQDNSYLRIIKSYDWYVFDKYINDNFSKDYKIIRCDSILSKRNEFYTRSFLDMAGKKCYVVDNSKELDTLIDKIDSMIDGSFQNRHVIVYKISDLDKRSKLYKRYKDLIVEPTISILDLANSILECDVDKNILANLYKYCNDSIARCYMELLKAKYLVDCGAYTDSNLAVRDIVDSLTSQESIGGYTVDTFKLVDAIISKDIAAIKDYIQNINTNEFDFGLITLLYNNYHNLAAVKEAGVKASPETTGLSPYLISIARNNCQKYSLEQLNNILIKLYNIDKYVKSGRIDSSYAYDLMLVRLLS